MRLLLLLSLLTVLGAETLQQMEQRARQLKAQGDAAGALAAFEKAAALQPKAAGLQDEIGFLLAVLQRQDEAIERFQQAITLNVDYAPAHYHLAVACWLNKDYDRALREFRLAAALNPQTFDYRDPYGMALNDARRGVVTGGGG